MRTTCSRCTRTGVLYRTYIFVLFVVTASEQTLLPSYDCGDKLSFAWWLVSHIVQIYQFDETGLRHADAVAPNDTVMADVIHDLVKRTCDAAGVQHGATRENGVMCRQLRYLLALNVTLPANISVINTLWEHFYKRLVSSCSGPGRNVLLFCSLVHAACVI